MRRRELEQRLRAAERRLHGPPYAAMRQAWLESGRWPPGNLRRTLLEHEEVLAEMALANLGDGAQPFGNYQPPAGQLDEARARLAAIQAAQRGDPAAESTVLELARQRAARGPW